MSHDDVIKWKHFPRYWPFVRGIHRSPVNYPYKGQWRGTLMFSFICVWRNGWVNNRKASDLRRYRDHYDVTVIILPIVIIVVILWIQWLEKEHNLVVITGSQGSVENAHLECIHCISWWPSIVQYWTICRHNDDKILVSPELRLQSEGAAPA